MSMFEKGLDFVAFFYALALFPAPFFWLIIHPAIDFWRRQGARTYWAAVPVWVAIGILLFLIRSSMFEERFERNPVTWALGAALLVLAVWLDRQVFREFSVRRLVGLPEIRREGETAQMVRSGVYAHVRHPRYLEYMLTFLSLALLTGAAGIFALAIVTVLMYVIVAPLEERELRNRYGAAYEAYAREVPRFIPRLRRRISAPAST